MTQHIHLRRSVTACLKNADVTDLCQKVGVRGNRIKEEFQEDKEPQSRQDEFRRFKASRIKTSEAATKRSSVNR